MILRIFIIYLEMVLKHSCNNMHFEIKQDKTVFFFEISGRQNKRGASLHFLHPRLSYLFTESASASVGDTKYMSLVFKNI